MTRPLRLIPREKIAAFGLVLACAASGHAADSQTPVPPPTQSAAEQTAAKLFTAADWPKAAVAYRDLVAQEATNPRAWFGFGVALHETASYVEALAALLNAAKFQYPQLNQLSYRLARTYARLGRTDDAFGALDRLVAGGFTNAALLQSPDFAAIAKEARFTAVVAAVNRNLRPCENDANFRRFDFWIGDWDVQPTGATRAPIGSGASSKIERVLDGCVIVENWTPLAGPAGKSFNTYNRVTRQWEQYWVDAAGRITHYRGEFRDDGNLYYEADQFGGPATKIRMTFFNQGANQVRQLGHQSSDGGKTWTVTFDLTYVRK